ncbi:unnamed protein product [Diatraea saccharalis]|uniref:SCP domain-containing protein n=1 Tax=Diatraea saccharalis TaxID=40085 RepID=A0A9N9QVV1_9NEOP|nr:unnamed protein product [Diatraea saccharalis]
MLVMSWDEQAAEQAQRYAEQCQYLVHNDNMERELPHYGSCGQNLFVASSKTPWFYALKVWFIEYQKFKYGVPVRDLKAVGHYTQMVWATTHKVGCGLAFCDGGPWGHFYNYVCHYCPGGNIDTLVHYPYKAGKPCSDCPDDCVQGKLCKNSCPRRDYFSNCDELLNTVPDYCSQGYCNATCECSGKKIYKNHPY